MIVERNPSAELILIDTDMEDKSQAKSTRPAKDEAH
jgi:hypothetical protein